MSRDINKLYNGEVVVERIFDDNNHYYGVNGNDTCSVTSVLNVIASPVLEAWKIKSVVNAIKDGMAETFPELPVTVVNGICEAAKRIPKQKASDAANVGTIVHEWLEKYGYAKMNDLPVPAKPDIPEAILAIDAFLEYAENNIMDFILVERVIYSKENDYVGTLDALVMLKDGRVALMDYKTSGGIYDKYYAQIGGYYLALVEELGIHIDCAIILRIGKDGISEHREIQYDDLQWLAEGFAHIVKTHQYNTRLKKYHNTVSGGYR